MRVDAEIDSLSNFLNMVSCFCGVSFKKKKKRLASRVSGHELLLPFEQKSNVNEEKTTNEVERIMNYRNDGNEGEIEFHRFLNLDCQVWPYGGSIHYFNITAGKKSQTVSTRP